MVLEFSSYLDRWSLYHGPRRRGSGRKTRYSDNGGRTYPYCPGGRPLGSRTEPQVQLAAASSSACNNLLFLGDEVAYNSGVWNCLLYKESWRGPILSLR
jgi:hypothetical protein